jgi:hypothetical protein
LFNTPILFIIYKNPKVTKLVFEKIREIKPSVLYISSDGPKENSFAEEVREINETRKIIENIDWDCKVYKKYEKINLGCKLGVSSAISWLFETEENGIILEYDCIPDLSFFRFCEILLEKYKDNEKIFSISGNNFDFGNINELNNDKNSYHFSHILKLWGWATWKRAWKFFDIELKDFNHFKKQNTIKDLILNKDHQNYWLDKINEVHVGINNSTWGFIWLYTLLNNKAYCITPNINLVSNIGFGDEATHAKDSTSIFSNMKTGSIQTINHPTIIEPNFESDSIFTEFLLKSEKISFYSRIKKYFSNFIKKQYLKWK